MIAVLAATLLLSTAELEQLRQQVRAAELAFHKEAREFQPCSDQVAPQESPLARQRYDVNSRGDFYDIYIRLRKLAFEPSAAFETLKITAADNGNVKLEAKVADTCFDLRWLESRPSEPIAGDPVAVLTRRQREYLEELRKWSADAKKAGGKQARRVLDAIEIVTDAWNYEQVALTELQFADERLTLRGVAIGATARDSVQKVTTGAQFTRSGDCSAFTATASVPATAVDDEATVANVFDERTEILCSTALPAPKALTAKGTGTLTLRARDIDAASLFMLLNQLSPADGFVVDQTVTGRFDVDFQNVTIGEALNALKAQGVAHVGAGPLHRVCKSECAPGLPEQNWAGEPVTLLVASVDVLDVFRVLHDVSGLPIHARALPGTISIYAQDVEWDRLFNTVASAAGKTFAIKGNTVHLDAEGAVPIEQLVRPTLPPRRTLVERDAKKLAVEDLRVAAVISNGTSTSAWARVPGASKNLFQLSEGMELFDGRVVAIAAGGVTVKTAAGRDVVLGN